VKESSHVLFQGTVTELINALPGNSSINMVQYATINEDVFSMWSAPHNNMAEVFPMWSVPSNNTKAVFSVHCSCREDIRFSVVQSSQLPNVEAGSNTSTIAL
jgi:hypothetical protein